MAEFEAGRVQRLEAKIPMDHTHHTTRGFPLDTFPQITTERLILRDFSASDAPAVFAIFSEDRVTEFYDLETFSSLGQAEKMVAARMRGNAELSGNYRRWAICLAHAPDTHIGSCGFHSVNKAFHSVEIGYDMHPAHWGKGYAYEAVAAMLGFCFANDLPFHTNRVAATTDLDSHRSMKLLKRLGFFEEGVLRQYGFWKGRYQDVRMFSLLRDDWESR